MLPVVGFNSRGQLKSGRDEVIPLVSGNVMHEMDRFGIIDPRGPMFRSPAGFRTWLKTGNTNRLTIIRYESTMTGRVQLEEWSGDEDEMNLKTPRDLRQRRGGFTTIELVICLDHCVESTPSSVCCRWVSTSRRTTARKRSSFRTACTDEAIRSGATGLDNLTNHVDYIRIDETSNRAGYRWETEAPAQGIVTCFLQGSGNCRLAQHAGRRIWWAIDGENCHAVDTQSGVQLHPRRCGRSPAGGGSGGVRSRHGVFLSADFEVRPVRTVEDWAGYDGTVVGNANTFRALNFSRLN